MLIKVPLLLGQELSEDRRRVADLAVSLSEGAGQQRVKDDDGLVEVPDEDSLEFRVGARRRVLATAATPTAARRPCSSTPVHIIRVIIGVQGVRVPPTL